MSVMIDTNIWLDIALDRDAFSEDNVDIFVTLSIHRPRR